LDVCMALPLIIFKESLRQGTDESDETTFVFA
jgi:hypothetical protein